MRDAPIQLQSPSGLLIEASTGSADGVLDQVYQDYDAAFVLENEKEGRDGFVECLALNGAPMPAWRRVSGLFASSCWSRATAQTARASAGPISSPSRLRSPGRPAPGCCR